MLLELAGYCNHFVTAAQLGRHAWRLTGRQDRMNRMRRPRMVARREVYSGLTRVTGRPGLRLQAHEQRPARSPAGRLMGEAAAQHAAFERADDVQRKTGGGEGGGGGGVRHEAEASQCE